MTEAQRCAGALVYDTDGRLLVVRRGRPPAAGTWCEPSGRLLRGESAAAGAVRECAEETGLIVRPLRRAGSIEVPGDGTVYDIEDYVCEVVGGSLRAGDDATEVRWASRAEFDELDLAPGVREALTDWGCLPR